MDTQRTILILFGLIICLWERNGVHTQNIVQSPENVGALNGWQSKMTCRIDDLATDSMEWVFYPNGTRPGHRVYYYDNRDKVEQTPSPLFDVDPAGREQGNFDLIITETSEAMAGTYECKIIKQNLVEEGNFVSLHDVTCNPPPGEKQVTEGTYVDLVCEVMYTGYKPPALNWHNDASDYHGVWYWDYERSRLTSNVTADAIHDGMEFTCDLLFLQDGGDLGPAPTYNDSCTTYFNVLHYATSVIITPDPEGIVTVNVGSHLNCSASGNPEPVMIWEELSGEQHMGSSLKMEEEWADQIKIFTCVAKNSINGVEKSARLNITVEVVSTNPEEVTTSGGVETWVIVVAVVVPIVVIGIIVGAVCGYKQHKKKKKKEKDLQTLGSSPDEVMGPGTGMQQGHQYSRQGPPPGAQRGRPPPGAHGVQGRPPTKPKPTANGKSPPVFTGAADMFPAGMETAQHKRQGKDSPGYGDLGIKQFGSTSNGLDSSVEFDPDPHQYNPKVQGIHGPNAARTPRHSQGSQLEGSYPYENIHGGHPPQAVPGYENIHGGYPPQAAQGPPQPAPRPRGQGSVASINRVGLSGSQASLSNMQASRGQMGSQGSISQLRAARGYMGSQGSIGHIQASRGQMGSQASLASQGHIQLQLAADMPDTQV